MGFSAEPLERLIPVNRIRVQGASLMEYLLIGGLLIPVSIVAMMLFGHQFQGWLSGLKADMSHSPGSQAAIAAVTNQPAAGSATGSQTTVSINDNIVKTVVQNKTVSQDLKNIVVTSGANGATNYLASQMETTAQKLLQQGKITQEQANTLTQLSNKGHQIAEIQALIEQAAADAGSDWTKFSETQITYQGNTYTPNQLSHLASSDLNHWTDINQDSATFMQSATNAGNGSVFQDFVDLYNQASATITDPAAKNTINTLSSNILFISVSVEANTDPTGSNTGNDPSKIETAVATDTSQFNAASETISGATNTNSAGICTTGGSQDTGTACK